MCRPLQNGAEADLRGHATGRVRHDRFPKPAFEISANFLHGVLLVIVNDPAGVQWTRPRFVVPVVDLVTAASDDPADAHDRAVSLVDGHEPAVEFTRQVLHTRVQSRSLVSLPPLS